MYVFLVFLGAVTTAAGLALVTSVASGAFDAESVTPGMIAAVGGLLLVGLGLTVRALQRIERALEMRPMLHPARTAAAAAERTDGPDPVPFPARPKPDSAARAASPAVSTAPTPAAEDAALERLREKFPTLVRLENAPAVEEADVSLLPPASAGTQGNGSGTVNGAAVARTNGAVPAKPAPTNARVSASSARPKGSMFDAFWPKVPRPRKDGEEAPARSPAPPPAAELTDENEVTAVEAPPAIEEPAASAPAPVSVLKSGVVEGRAYTLYSDGSIEAQFPQGMMRFGSIAELRNHIESSS
jgi:hypothetical protein